MTTTNDARVVRWLRLAEDAGACAPRGAHFRQLEADERLTEDAVKPGDAMWMLRNVPEGRLTPADVTALLARVTGSWAASWLLRNVPDGRLMAADIHALVARVARSWDAACVLRYAPADRLSAADRAQLEAVAQD